jgi:hypothetical protein
VKFAEKAGRASLQVQVMKDQGMKSRLFMRMLRVAVRSFTGKAADMFRTLHFSGERLRGTIGWPLGSEPLSYQHGN